MNKTFGSMTLIVMVGVLFTSGYAIAGPENINLNWGHQLNASDTACPSGTKVLNVMRKVTNSLDSGTGMNQYDTVWWATIDYVQQVQVIQTGPGEFCATVKNQGSFESVGGDSPGCAGNSNCGTSDGYLAPGVVGTLQGGATITFTGTFSPGNMRTKGNIGTLDQECDATQANGGCNGAGFTAWLNEYFTGVAGFSYDWWGWVYHAGDNGSWVNAESGNEGNIVGE